MMIVDANDIMIDLIDVDPNIDNQARGERHNSGDSLIIMIINLEDVLRDK